METNDSGYLNQVIDLLKKVEKEQSGNIDKAAELMAGAIEKDELIHVYGGGGHTTMVMGEMFFRAGGLANINPIMEPGLSVFNQALKYLELERTVNYGSAIVKYFRIQKDEVLIIFHNIGINAATIDAAMEAKANGAKIIAVSSSFWQNEIPEDHFIRHPNKKNLFDYADVCIDDYNPVGDAVIEIEGFETAVYFDRNIPTEMINKARENVELIDLNKRMPDASLKEKIDEANRLMGELKRDAFMEKPHSFGYEKQDDAFPYEGGPILVHGTTLPDS